MYSRRVSRVTWRRPDVALAIAFLLTLPAVNTRIHVSDEIQNFSYLRSIWFDGDLSFDNEYRYFFDAGYTRDEGFRGTFMEPVTETGLRYNFSPIGSAILWTPFYAVADAGVRIARLFGATTPADGLSRPYLAAITIGSAVYGALAVAMSIAVARRITGHARSGALAMLVGTPLIFYMYAMPGMSHATSAFAVALVLWTWLRVREKWTLRGVALLAGVGALMTMVREQDGILVLVPAADYLWTRWRSGRIDFRGLASRAAVAAAVFMVVITPQLLAYKTLNGRFGPSRIISGKMHWTAPWLDDVLFSTSHGWFFWTPLALLGIAGLVAGTTRAAGMNDDGRRVAALLLFAVVLEMYVLGSLASWHLAGAFGQRRFVAVSLCLAVGLAVLLTLVRRAPARPLLVAAMALMIWWNVGLAIRFGENSMNRKQLELRQDLYRTFVDLPLRLPAIAYRYLFDRGSFYHSRPSDPATR